jgi:hypothetical protein
MNTSQIYIGAGIIILAVIALFVFLERRHRGEKGLSPLAGLAFAFVLAGILFGNDRLVGYSLMGIGVVLAVVDMFNKSKHK